MNQSANFKEFENVNQKVEFINDKVEQIESMQNFANTIENNFSQNQIKTSRRIAQISIIQIVIIFCVGIYHVYAIKSMFKVIAALAESEEWLYLPDREDPIILPRNSAPLHLVQRIRDEAHRFAITYHRNLRSKSALYSTLDRIDGVGEKRKHALFDAFITIDAIKSASLDQLKAVRGMNEPSAKAVYDFFHPVDSGDNENINE